MALNHRDKINKRTAIGVFAVGFLVVAISGATTPDHSFITFFDSVDSYIEWDEDESLPTHVVELVQREDASPTSTDLSVSFQVQGQDYENVEKIIQNASNLNNDFIQITIEPNSDK